MDEPGLYDGNPNLEDGVGKWGTLSYIVHSSSKPCDIALPQACIEATNASKSAQHDLYKAENEADQRLEAMKNQYSEVEFSGKAPLWVRGMTALGAAEAIMRQVDVVRANHAYKAAEQRQYNACPEVKFG